MRQLRALSVALALCVCGLVFSTAAAAATGLTWIGVDASEPNWSLSDNWTGGGAGATPTSAESLDFPAGLSGCGTCYVAKDDVPSLDITGLTIDDGSDDYELGADASNDPLTLGPAVSAPALAATTNSTTAGSARLGMPLILDAPQTWSIDGGDTDPGEGQLVLAGGLTATNASSDTLQINFSNDPFLQLYGDNEVGAVTADGADPSDSGVLAYLNGSIGLNAGAELNANGNSITLNDAGIWGDGTVGPLSSYGGVIAPGAGDPPGDMTVDGGVTLDSASAFSPLIDNSGTTPEADYAQLAATGNVDLGSSDLDIESGSNSGACPTLHFGSVYPLISTTGSITGTFSNAPTSGEAVDMDCSGAEPVLLINYNTATSPRTVTATVGPEATTTTTLDPFSAPSAGQRYTMTATVTSSAGTPMGTVEFESGVATGYVYVIGAPLPDPALSAIPGCANVPLTEVGSSYQATCTTTMAAAGSYVSWGPQFLPAADSALSASSSNGYGAPAEYAVTTLPTLKVGKAIRNGTAASLSVTCTAAQYATGPSICPLALSLSVRETRKGGKVTAIAAKSKAKPKATKRTVSIGTKTAALMSGQGAKKYTVTLNKVGQSLLKSHHTLTVKLTASSSGSVISTQTVTFKEPAKK
jgi:hypothetical protein